MKKRIIGVGLLIVFAVVCYAVAGPFLTLYQIASAVERQDSDKLARYIDFPALRASLKEQLGAHVAKEAASRMKDSPFAALAAGLATNLADGLVDSIVTPGGVASLMGGIIPELVRDAQKSLPQTPAIPKDPAAAQEGPKGGSLRADQSHPQGGAAWWMPDPLKNARFTYDSPSRFSVWVREDRDREIRFVLIRGGLSWKLGRIVLPLGS